MIDREYKEIMDRVKVTESMKADVLHSVASAPVFEHQKGRNIASSGRSGRWSRRLIAAVCAGAACAAGLLTFPALNAKYDTISPGYYELESGISSSTSAPASPPDTGAAVAEISDSVQAHDIDKGTTVRGYVEENDVVAQDSPALSGEVNTVTHVPSSAVNTPQSAASSHESASWSEEAPSGISGPGENSQASDKPDGFVSGASSGVNEGTPQPAPDPGEAPSLAEGGSNEAPIAAAGPGSPPPPEVTTIPEAVPEPSEAPAGCVASHSPEPSSGTLDNAEESSPAASDTPEPTSFPVASESSSPLPTSCILP